jgi:outer membrane protein assembly factor BamB
MPSRPATTALVFLNLVLVLAFVLAHPERPPTLDAGQPLHLQWVHTLPPPRPAWPDQVRLQFDAADRPVLHEGTVYIASSHEDTVQSFDAATGRRRWRFRADGPVRFAPVPWADRVFFVSDDGYLYCLDSETGRLEWKFRGAPADRKVLGNGRLISTWPARGAPVVVPETGIPGDPHRLAPGRGSGEATVYFAAGIWPFMGIFLHALDARTGAVLWTNDGDSALYIKQPHQAEAFAGVAPQGMLAVAGSRLLVPSRSVPACYDRATGRMLHFRLAANSKVAGGADVWTNQHLFVNGGGAFDLETGVYLGPVGEPAALTADVLYTLIRGECRAYDARGSGRWPASIVNRQSISATPVAGPPRLLARVPLPGAQALVAAGNRLYVGALGRVFALPLPLRQGSAPRVWQATIDGTPHWLAADDEHLLVSTREGRLYCFGPHQPASHPEEGALRPPTPPAPLDDAYGRKADRLLRQSGVREGYCVAWGVSTGRLITELALRSRLHILAVESDPERAASVRIYLEKAGLYGDRIAIVPGSPETVALPPYLASLMVSEDLTAAGCEPDEAFLGRTFAMLRPYGGVACLPLPPGCRPDLAAWAGRHDDQAQARAHIDGEDLWLMRPGPLAGAADWTHEHGDSGNTRASRDRRVQAPLGLLWFGGTTNQGVLPRHGHGPQPQVVGGRLFIEGVDFLRALDVYTGRLLWETSLPGVGRAFDTLPHQPGANGAGANYVSTPEGIYIAHGTVCRRLDPATGQEIGSFRLPPLPGEVEPPVWDYVNVCDDFLVAGANSRSKGKQPTNAPITGSKHLYVLDRHSGRVLWQRTAESGFRHNALCLGRGRLYTIDRLSQEQIGWLTRRGEKSPSSGRLLALDLRNGAVLWETSRDVFGTWLSFSAEFDVLMESGRGGRDILADEPPGMRAYSGRDGRVLWYQPNYIGPAMILGRRVLRGISAAVSPTKAGAPAAGGSCDLLTGEPTFRPDPLTGLPVEWTWTRNYGCNTPLASENLLTFRSGAAGYYDLCREGGTGNFGGFRAGCTNNLIIADGVLTAADYTRMCTCSYQNQTSLALVPMPEAEMWTFTTPKKVEGVVRRVGIKLGAPGSRRADDGTLWLEHPPAGGPSPRLAVKTSPASPRWFRHHASSVDGAGPAWVMASGACGLAEVQVTLAPRTMGRPRRYTVRLYFLEPDHLGAGERRFDVALQGRKVLSGLDVSDEAGGPGRGLVKEFHDVLIDRDLTVRLTPDAAAPVPETVLCGIEVTAEGW